MQLKRLAGISWGVLACHKCSMHVIVGSDKGEVPRLRHFKTRSPGCETQIPVSMSVKYVRCLLHGEWISQISLSVISLCLSGRLHILSHEAVKS